VSGPGGAAHRLALPAGLAAEVLPPPAPPPVADLAAALAGALDQPIGSRPLREVVTARTRAVVILSDASHDEPRAALYAAVRRELSALKDDQISLAVASGARAPGDPAALGLPPEVRSRHRLVHHDGQQLAHMVDVGRTSRGTRLRLNRCLVEADLVVTTGRISPHPSAGYGGGCKGIFPGLGYVEDIQQNHRLRSDPASSLGRADLNPCREDLEEGARRLGRDTFMLDVVEAGGAVLGAVAGDLVLAHREGVRRLRPFVEVEAAPAEVVIVSAPPAATRTLHQAARLVPPAGQLLLDGGVVILVAGCGEGLGPPGLVSAQAFERGLRRYLPLRYTLLLVSSLDPAALAGTFARPAPSLEAALEEARGLTGPAPRVLVLPDARDLVPLRAAAR